MFRLARSIVVVLATGSVLCQVPRPPDAKPLRPLRERLLERALRGDTEAQFDLARNYETGRIGLQKNVLQAEHWYREAANQGEPFAQASLAILLGFGKGVPPDLVQALMWYELATDRTSGGDRITIAEMRDDLALKMTAQQIAEARRLAHEWKSKEPKPKEKTQ